MTRLLFVDPIGGAAGDMLLAALLDAGASEAAVLETIDTILPGRFAVSTAEVRRGSFRAWALRIEPRGGQSPPVEARFAALDAGTLPDPIRARARLVLDRLAGAEARVHGGEPGDPSPHALDDEDTWIDVLGIAAALHALDVERVVVGALPLGVGGSVPGPEGHGPIPLPAPATVELLRGFAVRPGGHEETVTPTAAAVFAALGEPGDAIPAMSLDAVGYGAGTRDTSVPNVVRVIAGTPSTADAAKSRPLTVLEANLDDLTPELVADAAEALLAAGALDVWTTPVQMKKGRSAVILSALCDPSNEPAVRRAFFEATSTFGVRGHDVTRTELDRRSVAVEVAGGTVRIKVGLLDGRIVSATPEHDDVAELARQAGRPVREVYEEAAAAARQLREGQVQQR